MKMWEIYDLIEIICKEEIQEYRESMDVPLELEQDRFNIELDECKLEEILYDKFEINIEQLELLIEELLPLCQIAKSDLTNAVYQGFGKDGMWIIKRELK
jgi:hypothetical protein